MPSPTETPPKKFVVAEPEIRKLGGHYLQYAVHVLRGAKELGYEACVATNTTFTGQVEGGIAVCNVFRQGYWDRFKYPPPKPPLSDKLRQRFRQQVTRFKARLVVRRLYVQVTTYKKAIAIAALLLVGAAAVLLPKLTLWAAVLLAFLILAWRVARSGRFKRLVSRIENRLRPHPGDPHDLYAKRAIQEITEDLVRLAQQADLGPGDHLLMASVSGVELSAVLNAIESAPKLAEVHWTLVFRRNLRPDPAAPMRPDYEIDLLRATLARETAAYDSISLRTDTDALTYEYDMLSPRRFATLPIPHVVSRTGAERMPAAPLVVSYLGDGRTEKGFHYLSRVVNMARERLLETGKVRYRLQANFDPPEAASLLARQELSSYPPEQVELILQAQDEAAYQAHLEESDIILVPYEIDNYSQRSSGIYSEAAGLSVPMIVQVGTWMSRQIRSVEYRELAKAWPGLDPAAARAEPVGEKRSALAGLTHAWVYQGHEPAFLYRWQIPAGSGQALVHLPFSNRWFVEALVRQRDGTEHTVKEQVTFAEALGVEDPTDAYLLIDLDPQAKELAIELKGYESETCEAGFIPADAPIKPAAPGVVYNHWTGLSNALENLVRRHSDYKTNAAAYASEFTRFHSVENFLSLLKGVGGR